MGIQPFKVRLPADRQEMGREGDQRRSDSLFGAHMAHQTGNRSAGAITHPGCHAVGGWQRLSLRRPYPGVSAALGPIRTVVRHMPAVHHSQVSQVLRIIEASNAYWATKAAFRFMTYTAARNGMVRGARWKEIDLASATWTVPGERVKSGRAFTVPLSQAALAVLEQAWQHTAGMGLVFPSPTGRPLSDGTLSKLCRENNVGCVPHGTRSSFRDWCAETGVPNRVAEQALAHTPRGLRATGIRTDYLQARRQVMEMWAIYLTGTTSPTNQTNRLRINARIGRSDHHIAPPGPNQQIPIHPNTALYGRNRTPNMTEKGNPTTMKKKERKSWGQSWPNPPPHRGDTMTVPAGTI